MGAICPKGKISKARRDKRRAQNYKLVPPNFIRCECGELVLRHRACKACGRYKKQQVIEVD